MDAGHISPADTRAATPPAHGVEGGGRHRDSRLSAPARSAAFSGAPATAVFDVGGAVGISVGRRLLDVVVSLTALVLLLPLFLGIALAVRASSRGPVLYRQLRVGAGGRPFELYKFRSMRWRSGGSAVTPQGDPRVTRVGRALRALALDELPQLVNVLRGEMTLVGPRPEVVELARRYPEWARTVFRHRPGLTGPGQLRVRDEEVLCADEDSLEDHYLAEVVPRRCALDLDYLAAPTLRRTLGLLAQTGAYLLRRITGRRPRRRTPLAPSS